MGSRRLVAGQPRKVSVAQLGPDPGGRGGMAAVLEGLLESPLADRYEMVMIVTYRSARPLPRLLTFVRSLWQLTCWSMRAGPRVAHVHTAARGSLYRKSLLVFLARLLRQPVLVQVHAGMGDIEAFALRLGAFRRRVIARALAAATLVVAVSAESAKMMEHCFDLVGVGVVPNAAPTVTDTDLVEARRRRGLRALYVGGFANPVKGGEVLSDALGRYPELLGGLELLIAGPGDPPAALRRLQSTGGPPVRLLGWLDGPSKRDALTACSVFILPSTSEGLPVALLEAMAWGMAIVATDVGGVPEVVEHGRSALIVPPGDPGALAKALARLADDADLRSRLGKQARDRALALNDVEVGARLDALYAELAR